MAISADTFIFLQDTETKISIKDIKSGAKIGSFDDDTGNYCWNEVRKLVEQNKEIFKITVKNGNEKTTLMASADQAVIVFIPDENSFFIVEICELEYGMYIMINAEDIVELKEDTIEVESLGMQTCYDVNVGGAPFMTFADKDSLMFLIA